MYSPRSYNMQGMSNEGGVVGSIVFRMGFTGFRERLKSTVHQ